MSHFGFNNNNDTLLHTLIAKVELLTKIINQNFDIDDSNVDSDIKPENIMKPKNFKELRYLVLHLAKNDMDRLKDSKELTDIILKQSKDINNLKKKFELINDDS